MCVVVTVGLPRDLPRAPGKRHCADIRAPVTDHAFTRALWKSAMDGPVVCPGGVP